MAQNIISGDSLVFAFYDHNRLKRLIYDFREKFAIQNKLDSLPQYEDILISLSVFSVISNWNETIFLTKSQSLEIVPVYVNKRISYFSKDNQYSTTLVTEQIINKYYELLNYTHPKAVQFCNQLIKIILIAELDSYIEGTTADGLGIAHIDFKRNFNQEDFNELIIHQITHMLLFVDDFIDPQVDASNKQRLIKTAATHKRGGNSFPLYILFHSFCVGVEVLNYRFNFQPHCALVNYHPNTLTATIRCKEGFTILTEHIKLFSSKGEELLNLYGGLLDELILKAEQVA